MVVLTIQRDLVWQERDWSEERTIGEILNFILIKNEDSSSGSLNSISEYIMFKDKNKIYRSELSR